MPVYLDPPMWPQRGRLFSHLISDHSLDELHNFATRAGIPPRAFDRDHYDVPQERYQRLKDLGAREVSAGELTRLLLSSGLRVPARRRPESLGTALLLRWNRLLPEAPQLGRELLARWAEPHRHYHSTTHLLGILEALEALSRHLPVRHPSTEVLLAAWFHDAVYLGRPGDDEEESAQLAERLLRGFITTAQLQEVSRLVLLTRDHDPLPGDEAGALLCDADLAILGAEEPDYHRYATAVRADYAQVPDADFRAGRSAVLERLLASKQLYQTPYGKVSWEASARRNLRAELAALHRQDFARSL